MGWRVISITAPIVIIESGAPNTGLFIYSGTPALGNPPIGYATAPGTTTDPFGNALPATTGGFVTTNGTSFAQLLAVALTFGAAGNTINPVVGGSGNGLQLASGATVAAPVQAIVNLNPAAAAPASMQLAANTQIQFQTDTTIARTAAGQVTIGSNLVVSTILVNALDLANQSVAPTPPASSSVVYSDVNGYPAAKVAVSGDTNAYSVASLFKQVSPRSQNFSAVAAANIGGLSATVGIGTYIVRARLIIEWAALAGTPQMQFAGPAISQYDVSFKSQQSGTTSTANDANTTASGTVNGSGYNSGLIGITVAMTANGIFFDMDIWGMFTFTASGTLTLQAASSVAANVWTVVSGFWEVCPIG